MLARRGTPQLQARADMDPEERLLKRTLHPKTIALPWEHPASYERLRIQLVMQLKPKGELECVLLDHIVASIWQLRRCYRIETGLLANSNLDVAEHQASKEKAELLVPYDLTGIVETQEQVEPPPSTVPDEDGSAPHTLVNWDDKFVYQPCLTSEAMAFAACHEEGDLEGLRRYRKSIEDSVYRDLHELQRLQARYPLPALDLADVDADPLLRRRWGLKVPVLLLEGALVCQHRLDTAELLRLLRL